MVMSNKGFTLVELMIVIAVIAIIATLAIPNMLRSRMNANESAAVGSMHVIASGEMGFQTAGYLDADGDGQGDYGTLSELANPDGSGLTEPFIDDVLGGGRKLGYVFTAAVIHGSVTTAPAFVCVAVPASPARTGLRQFFVDETGVIRYTSDGTAVSASSKPLG